MLNQFTYFILQELSAGSFSQNVGFYTLISLLIWIIVVQFKYRSRKYRVNWSGLHTWIFRLFL